MLHQEGIYIPIDMNLEMQTQETQQPHKDYALVVGAQLSSGETCDRFSCLAVHMCATWIMYIRESLTATASHAIDPKSGYAVGQRHIANARSGTSTHMNVDTSFFTKTKRMAIKCIHINHIRHSSFELTLSAFLVWQVWQGRAWPSHGALLPRGDEINAW